jgi:hypothetical protein
MMVTLQVPSARLRSIIGPASTVKEEQATKNGNSPSDLPAVTNGETASDSTPGTPAADGTPFAFPMGPPTEGPKKKSYKRNSTAANGLSEPKSRAKPGPKKKQKL